MAHFKMQKIIYCLCETRILLATSYQSKQHPPQPNTNIFTHTHTITSITTVVHDLFDHAMRLTKISSRLSTKISTNLSKHFYICVTLPKKNIFFSPTFCQITLNTTQKRIVFWLSPSCVFPHCLVQ